MRARLGAVLLAVVAAISVACGTNSDGKPVLGAQWSGNSVASPIPLVQNPRDVAPMARRACDLLTPQQASVFGLDLPPKQTDGLFGTTDCKWTTVDHEGTTVRRVYVSMFTNNPTVEVAYAQRAGFAFFKLDLVNGYPSAITRSNADVPNCTFDVKTAERQSVTVTYDSEDLRSDPQRSCDVAKRVASAVLTNLPPKG